MSKKQVETNKPESKVIYEKKGKIAYITLNRPRVLNALDLQTHAELALIWDDFEKDDRIKIGVLTGAGNKAFSVGQDLKELSMQIKNSAPSTFGSREALGWPRLTERFDLSKPLIAKINGYALGGGFELALACDIIIAAEHSVFALPEATLGFIPGAGGVFRLVRHIPFKIAMGYLLTGRRLSAKRAYELGIVNEVTSIHKLDECVNTWIKDILRCAPLSVRSIKEAALKSVDLSLQDAFAASYKWEKHRLQNIDSEEGLLAFLEKRCPNWNE